MKIEIKPRFHAFAHCLESGHNILAADADFRRPDGKFAGLGLHIQASCMGTEHVHPDDAEMFYQAVALLSAAPDLLEALRVAYSDIQRLPGHTIDMLGRIEAAIVKATTHPLHNEMAAREIAYEESQEMARARAAERADRDEGHDDDRDHLTDENTDFGDPDPYLYGDEDTGEDTNVELLQGAADAASEAAVEDRLLAGGAA